MSLNSLIQGVIAAEVVPGAPNQTQSKETVERGAQVALTARAVIVVSFVGAGCWYLLWKLALLFVPGR